MTIRLLSKHGIYPVNSTVTLDAATEAGLIAAKIASATLTGGVPYVPAVEPDTYEICKVRKNAAGVVQGLTDSAGNPIAIGTVAGTAPSATTSAAIVGTPEVNVPLSITAAVFAGNPTPTVTRTIQVAGVTVATGPVGSTNYTPVTADIGKTIVVISVATNGTAPDATATSAPSAAVIAAQPATIAPNAPIIGTLVANTGGFTVNFTPGAFTNANAPSDYVATLSDGTQEIVTASPATFVGKPANFSATASVVARNAINSSPPSGVSISATTSATQAAPATLSGIANILCWDGQSNAACAGSIQNNIMQNGVLRNNVLIAPPSNVVDMTDVYIWDPYNAQWLAYKPGKNSSVHQNGGLYPNPSSQYWGGEAEFARQWKIAKPGVPLFIVKSAYTSTSLDQAARAAQRGCWDPALTNDLFAQSRDQLLAARANLTAKGGTPFVRADVWTQGENDVGNAGAATRYNANLTALVDARRASGALDATSPFVISRTQMVSGYNVSQNTTVRAAQEAVGTGKAYCRMFDVDSLVTADGLHYNSAGIIEQGRRAYDASAVASEVVAALIARMTVPEDSTRQAAMVTMVQGLMDAGVFGTMAALQVYAASTQQAALLDWKNPALVPTVANMAFTANQGFKSTSTANNSNSWVDTKMVPSTDPSIATTSAAYAVVIRNAISGGGGGVDLGAFGNSVRIQLYANDLSSGGTNTGTAGYCMHTSIAPPNVTAPASASGLWVMTRTAQNATALYNKGVQLGATDSTQQSAVVRPNVSMMVGNRNGFMPAGSLNQYPLFFACSGITASQAAKVNAAIDTYLTGIGAL